MITGVKYDEADHSSVLNEDLNILNVYQLLKLDTASIILIGTESRMGQFQTKLKPGLRNAAAYIPTTPEQQLPGITS